MQCNWTELNIRYFKSITYSNKEKWEKLLHSFLEQHWAVSEKEKKHWHNRSVSELQRGRGNQTKGHIIKKVKEQLLIDTLTYVMYLQMMFFTFKVHFRFALMGFISLINCCSCLIFKKFCFMILTRVWFRTEAGWASTPAPVSCTQTYFRRSVWQAEGSDVNNSQLVDFWALVCSPQVIGRHWRRQITDWPGNTLAMGSIICSL